MGKIASFEEFKKKASQLTEDDLEMNVPMESPAAEEGHGSEHQYYMFFKNLSAIKHYIEEIEQMDPDQLDDLLKGGHDWASDHIATSKDDIQEVAEWVRSEMEGAGGHHEESPENIIVDIEGDNDEVEIEGGEGEEEDEESGKEPEETEDEEDEE